MTQTDVALTDYGLTVECALFGFLLFRMAAHTGHVEFDLLTFFSSLALAAAAGGTVHGFFLDERRLSHKILWRFTLVMVGVAALSAVRIGATMLMREGTADNVSRVAEVLFVVYAITALFFWQDFRLAILGYFPSLLLLGAAFLVQFNTHGKFSALVGCAGICTMIVAALVQQFRVGISARYFDHNALYHLLQAAALYMLFIAVRPAMA